MQRNMAANSGLDYRAAAEFVGCIVARELRRMRREQAGCSSSSTAQHLFSLERAVPMLDGLCVALSQAESLPQHVGAGCEQETGSAGHCLHSVAHSQSNLEALEPLDLLTCTDEPAFLRMLQCLLTSAREAIESRCPGSTQEQPHVND